MKRTSTLFEILKKSLLFLFCFTTITLFSGKLYGQAKERVYATSQSKNTTGLCLFCNVTTDGNAADGKPSTKSTINLPVGLAGPTIYQDLKFADNNIPGNTEVVVKIGTTGKLLTANVLGGVKIQAINSSGALVGPQMDGNSGLLTLLAVGNQTEIFVTPGVAFAGVRVTLDGGLINVAATIEVYDAYYLKDATNANCDKPIDELHGISGNIAGLGGVANPLNAIDGSDATFSTLQAAVGVLGYSQQTIIFPGLSSAKDSVRMLVSTTDALISLNLLNSISVETFKGNISNGVINNSGGLLSLRLLNPGGNIGILTFSPGEPFDRVQLRMGGAASVLAALNLHEVSRVMSLPVSIKVNTINSVSGIACLNDGVALNIENPEANVIYTWYTQASGGTGVVGVSFTPANLTTGTHKFYVTGKRPGCQFESDRKLVTITVKNPTLPIVNAPLPTCSGGQITLTVNAPVGGQSYRWFDQETGGSVLFTGNSFTTPVLTASKSFYVETFIESCVSVRTKVDVTVNPIPANATVALSNVEITKGQTATLTASPEVGSTGNTVKWYTASTGGIAVFTGAVFKTPPLNATTIYYAEIQNVGGCVSAGRVPVTVTVTDINPGSACNVPNAQGSGVEGLLCVLCGVENGANAINSDPTKFSSLRLTLGVGGQVYQRLFFPGAGAATDSIRLDLAIPGGIADLSLLGGVTINVMSNGAVVKSYPLNSGILHLSLLSGNRFKATLPAGAAYDAVEIRLGAVATALTTVDVYGAQVIYPNPTIPAGGFNACSGSTNTFTATPVGGTSLKWFANSTGGVALATGNSYSPSGLTQTTTYFIEVSNGTCVNAERFPVKVNVNPAIVFAASALTNATPGSSYSKQITLATGGTPAFTYKLATGASLPAGLTLSADGTIAGTPTAAPGDYSFTITATDSKGCSVDAIYNLKVTEGMSLPDKLLPNGIVNTLYPTQVIPGASGGTTPYTYTATNLPPGLGFNDLTREITGTPTQKGSFPVHVTATDKNGNSVTKDYIIVVRDPLVLAQTTLANGTVNVLYPTQTIPAATGGSGSYNYTASNLPSGLGFDPITRAITGTPTVAGTFVIPVKVTDTEGNTVTTNYTIVVGNPLLLATKPLADGTVGVTYVTETIPAATGGDGNYTYTASNLPLGLSFDAATRKISGTPTKSGSYNVSVNVTDGAGASATQVYVIKVNGELNLPSATLPNGLVGAVYPTQILPAVTGGTSPYTYDLQGLPPALTFDVATREIKGTPVTGGTFTLTMTATDKNGITTSTDYTLVVNVSAPVVAAVTTCSGSTATMTVTNADPSFTYKWYASTGSTSIYSGPTFTTTALTSNTTYYVEAISGTAVSTRTPVNVTINPAPEMATVISANESISSGQKATLSVSAAAGNTIKWYTTSTGGSSFFTGANYTTPALSATTTYYVETENASGCVSATRAAVTVTVSSGPANPNCNAAVRQETGIDGICLLCGVDNAGNSTDDNPNNFTKINLVVGVGSTGYQRLIFARTGAATDSIRLDLATPVGLADVNVLGGITITVMNGNTPVTTYALNNSVIDLKLLGGTRFKATLPAGGVYDRVEIRFGALVAALSNLSIYGAEVIYPNPTVAAAGQLICAGSGTTLTATANGGTTLKWYATATSTTVLATGETFTVAGPLTENTTYYIEVSKDGCANAQRIPVTVVVTTAPGVPTLAATAEVCAGSPAVLPVSNPITGTTYKWYTSSTGGTAIFEGAVFTTPALSANITYYVEASNGNCVSANRAAVAVRVNPLPVLPQVQVSSNTVSPGQTAILNATSTESNVIFNWYSTANATTPIYTGPTYVTTPLMVTTTYFLEAVSPTTGCAASSRVQITINVDGNGVPNPVPCEAASTQTKGVDGIALLADVFNPGLAIDDDTKTGSSLVLPVGLLGGSVYQKVGFNGLSTVGDTVRIKLTAPGKLLSLGVLGGITLTTYSGATSNNDELLLNNALINLELLSGNTEALLSFVPTKTFDQVEVRLNAGIAGVLTTVDLNYAQRVMVAPTVTASVVNICATQTATLSVANPTPGLIYKWYNSTGAYIAGKDGTTFVTDALSADTKYYVASSNAVCTSYKSLIEVKVSAAPATPELESPIVTTCANNDVVLRVKNPVAGVTYQWFDGTNTYLAGKDGSTLQVTVGLTDETYTVKAFDNTCGITSAAATATIKVGSLDIPIITPPSITVKVNSPAVLTASSSTADVIFTWYDAPNGGTLLHTGPTYITVPRTTPGVVTYYVEGSVAGGCTTNTRATVTVTTIPNGIATDVPCEPAIIENHGVEGIAVLADVYNPLLAVDNNASTASSLVIPVGLLGGAVYQQLGFDGISNLGDTVRIMLTSPGKILTLSVLPSLEISTLKNGVSNNDAIVINNPLINLELLSGGTQALLTFVPTSTFDAVQVKLNSGLVGAFSSIDINYAQRVLVAPTVAAKTATVCAGSAATLSINNPLPNVTYKWYKGTTFQADGTTFNTATDLPVGDHEFFVVAERKGCPSVRVKVVVAVLPVPVVPVPDAGNPASTCIGSAVTLKVTQVAGVVFNWYDAAVGGNQLVANNISYTTSANLAAGTYDYYVEAVNENSCINATRTKITLTVKANAVASDITAADKTICSGTTATLTATATAFPGAIFKWYTTPGLTDTPFEGASFTTLALTATTKYYVIITGANICANDATSAKVVTVTVNRNAVASDIVAADKTICSGSTANLTASTTKVTAPVFSWYKNADLSDVPFIGASFTTDALIATTKYYVTVSGSDACANDAASAKVVTVTVNRNATAADIDAADRTTCIGTAVTLTAGSTTVTNPVFSWYRDANLTDLAVRATSFTTPALSVTTKYYVTVSGSDVCANDALSAKVVTVNVNRNATASDIILADQAICAGTTAVLSASSTTVDNPVFRWYRDASLTDFAFQGPTSTTPALTLTTKYYVTVSGTNACANDVVSAKVVTVTVNRNAGVTDIIAADQTICSGVNTQLTASSATVTSNPVFTWYRDAALTDVAFVGNNMPVLGLTATTRFYVTVKGDGVCANLPGSAKVVTVTVNPLPNVPIISTTGTAICSGNTTVLTIQNPQTGVIYEWYTAATGGTLVNTGISFSTGTLNANVDYFVQATNTTNCGSIAGRVKVTVVVTTTPQTPSVVSGTVNTCLGSTAILSVSGPVTGITYNWYATAVSSTILGSGVNFTTPATTMAMTTYYVEASSGTCKSASRTPVVVNAGAIPLPPPSVSGAESPLCPGSTTVLTVNNPDPALKYTWYTTATGGTGVDGTTFNVPVLNATTIYYVGSSNIASGCTSATRTAVTVTVLGKLDAPVVSTSAVTATSITFAWPAVTNAVGYEVSVDNGLNWTAPSSGAAGTTHMVSGLQPNQRVTIRVRAVGQLACQLSDATTFTGNSDNPLGNNIFVPNTFTPNNDGKNDVLYVYGNTIAKIQLRVYSQWGQFIYESLKIENGWDGTFKGQMQPNGVYVYYLEVEFNDGTKATKKGTITLLR
jgi:gliding motility-associated-like protein